MLPGRDQLGRRFVEAGRLHLPDTEDARAREGVEAAVGEGHRETDRHENHDQDR